MSVKTDIEERKRKVRSLLAEGLTEAEIAAKLGVAQSTISSDVTALKEDSRKYIYDLAKTDLAYVYQRSIDELDKLTGIAWKILQDPETKENKDKLLAVKTIRELIESKFNLFQQGPTVLNIKMLSDRLDGMERRRGYGNNNGNNGGV